MQFKYFKIFEEEKISLLSLVCFVKGIAFNEENSFYEILELENGITIKKKKTIGNFSDLVKEYDYINKYSDIQVFTNELEFSLFCPDRVLYLYSDEDGVKNIDLVGKYLYVANRHEVCTGVDLDSECTDNFYMVNFIEFVLNNETDIDFNGSQLYLSYKDNIFTIYKVDDDKKDLLLEIKNVSKRICYPYVLYSLKHIDRGNESIMIDCKKQKITRV